MGRGNWFPGNSLEDVRLVYVDLSDEDADPEDTDAGQWRWQCFRENLMHCLPKSFTEVESMRDLPHAYWLDDRDTSPLAYNSLFTLWCDGQGDDHHFGIGFTVNETAPGFAKWRLDDTANLVFDRLSEMYELRVRSCAWTSSPYVVSKPTLVETV